MKFCGVSHMMSSPFEFNVNLGLVENMNLEEYHPCWTGDSFAPELANSFANVIGRRRAPEMRPDEDVKKTISERVRQKMHREGKSEDFPRLKRPSRPAPVVQKEEDPDKIRIRRERNKIAATKCRQRRRERIKTLKKKIDDLQSNQKKMTEEISSLKQKKATLEHAYTNHWCILGRQPAPTQSGASTSCTQPILYQIPPYYQR